MEHLKKLILPITMVLRVLRVLVRIIENPEPKKPQDKSNL